MKKNLFLCLLALCCSIGMRAESGTCGNLSWEFSNGTLTITGSGVIPSYAYDKTPWYSLRESIIIISLPEGLTAIGNNAFNGCNKIKTVTIPDAVTVIGEGAFKYCSAMTHVVFGSGVETIGNYAFYECTQLKSPSFPA